MRPKLIIIAGLLLCVSAVAGNSAWNARKGLLVYLSPDSGSSKLAGSIAGAKVVILETSGGWLHVEAVLSEEKAITGWMVNKGVVLGSTPNGDKIVFGEAVNSEHQASRTGRAARRGAGCDAYYGQPSIFHVPLRR